MRIGLEPSAGKLPIDDNCLWLYSIHTLLCTCTYIQKYVWLDPLGWKVCESWEAQGKKNTIDASPLFRHWTSPIYRWDKSQAPSCKAFDGWVLVGLSSSSWNLIEFFRTGATHHVNWVRFNYVRSQHDAPTSSWWLDLSISTPFYFYFIHLYKTTTNESAQLDSSLALQKLNQSSGPSDSLSWPSWVGSKADIHSLH